MDVLTLTAPDASMDKETHVCGGVWGGGKERGKEEKDSEIQRHKGGAEKREREGRDRQRHRDIPVGRE